MNNTEIWLVYKTDKWHTKESRELVYIGEDFADSVEQVAEYCDCTKEQAEQLWQHHQSQCDDSEVEWEIVEQKLNQFVEL